MHRLYRKSRSQDDKLLIINERYIDGLWTGLTRDEPISRPGRGARGFTRLVRVAWDQHVLHVLLGADSCCIWYLRLTHVCLNV